MADTQTSNGKSDLTEVGAFWKKVKDGKTFLSGKVKIGDKEYTAFIFPNKKGKDTHPDYRLSVAGLEEAPRAEDVPTGDSVAGDDIPF
jgi:uncharacterized protein (DUF736 family)